MKVGANEGFRYVCAAGVLVALVLCDYEHTCSSEMMDRSPRGTCGSDLADAVRLACDHIDLFFKRGIMDTDRGQGRRLLGPGDPVDESSLATKYVKKRFSNTDIYTQSRALQFLRSRRRLYEAQNIVCECCYHRCTHIELAQYC